VLIQELKHKNHIKYSRRSLSQGIEFGSNLHGEDLQEDLCLAFVSLYL